MTGFNSPNLRNRALDYPGDLDADILAHWSAGRDTMDISRALCVPESIVANKLPKLIERRRQDRRWNSHVA
jgi:hypothetical protein